MRAVGLSLAILAVTAIAQAVIYRRSAPARRVELAMSGATAIGDGVSAAVAPLVSAELQYDYSLAPGAPDHLATAQANYLGKLTLKKVHFTRAIWIADDPIRLRAGRETRNGGIQVGRGMWSVRAAQMYVADLRNNSLSS